MRKFYSKSLFIFGLGLLNLGPMNFSISSALAAEGEVVGDNHSCFISTSGELFCKGSNKYGQLGDGTYVDRKKFTAVIQVLQSVEAVVVGDRHTCFLLKNFQTIQCMGDNSLGQLGQKQRISKTNKPVTVQILKARGRDPALLGIDSDPLGKDTSKTCARVHPSESLLVGGVSEGAIEICWGGGKIIEKPAEKDTGYHIILNSALTLSKGTEFAGYGVYLGGEMVNAVGQIFQYVGKGARNVALGSQSLQKKIDSTSVRMVRYGKSWGEPVRRIAPAKKAGYGVSRWLLGSKDEDEDEEDQDDEHRLIGYNSDSSDSDDAIENDADGSELEETEIKYPAKLQAVNPFLAKTKQRVKSVISTALIYSGSTLGAAQYPVAAVKYTFAATAGVNQGIGKAVSGTGKAVSYVGETIISVGEGTANFVHRPWIRGSIDGVENGVTWVVNKFAQGLAWINSAEK